MAINRNLNKAELYYQPNNYFNSKKTQELINELSNFDDRKINFILRIIKYKYDFVIIQPSIDYLISVITRVALNDLELDSLIRMTKESMIDNDIVYKENNLIFKLFCYYQFMNFYSFGANPINTYLPDFYENLILNIDINYTIFARLPTPQPFPNTHYQKTIPNYSSDTEEVDISQNRFSEIYKNYKNFMNLNAKVNMFNTLYDNYLNSRKISLNMSWIKKEDKFQLDWLIDYILKATKGTGFQIVYFPKDKQEAFDFILAFLMNESCTTVNQFSEYHSQALIKKIQNAWYQKNYRDKKNSNTALKFIISKQHLRKLNYLAEKSGSEPVELLEKLVEEAYNDIKS